MEHEQDEKRESHELIPLMDMEMQPMLRNPFRGKKAAPALQSLSAKDRKCHN